MPYLYCIECEGIYELKPGEYPNDFDICQCGGKLKYYIYLENINKPYLNPETKKQGPKSFSEKNKKNKPASVKDYLVIIFLAIITLFVMTQVLYYISNGTLTGSVDSLLGTHMSESDYENRFMELNDEAAILINDVSNAREESINGLITKEEELNRLKKARSGLDNIRNEFLNMHEPPGFEDTRLWAWGYSNDFITGLDYEIRAIEENNPNLYNDALTYYETSARETKYMAESFNQAV